MLHDFACGVKLKRIGRCNRYTQMRLTDFGCHLIGELLPQLDRLL